MKLLSSIFLMFFSLDALANCYVVGDIKGFSTRVANSLEISEDGLADQKFIIEIDGENSKVTPNSMSCSQMGESVLVCLDRKEGKKLSLETWAVYPAENKVVYTKINHGYSVFDGANLMVGNIKSECN